MRTIRIYQPGQYDIADLVALSPSAAQHVGVVLRMLPGEKIVLFCGDNREFLAVIESVQKRNIIVRIEEVYQANRESFRHLHLGQAISKGDRMEWVIQKAVELGVTSITPLLTERCMVRLDGERLAKKTQQWQSIAISAAEQSGRNQVTVVHSACSLDDFLTHCQATIKLVLYPEATKSWRDYDFPKGAMSLLIGPEGGLTQAEVDLATSRLFQPLSLGPRILRTETAAIAALSILQAVAGDL